MCFAACFLPQVTVCGQTAEGMGPSKKVAKRNAAEKMLELLGYKVPQPQPPKPALKTDEKVLPRLLSIIVNLADKEDFICDILLYCLDPSEKTR